MSLTGWLFNLTMTLSPLVTIVTVVCVVLFTTSFFAFDLSEVGNHVSKQPRASSFNPRQLDYDLEQCDLQFPGLFREIERSQDYWRLRGGVTKEDLEAAWTPPTGQVWGAIRGGVLYVKEVGSWHAQSRTLASMHAINSALETAPEDVPDIEFVIIARDGGDFQGAPWMYSRLENQESYTLIPDFGFYSWPEPGIGSHLDVQMESAEIEKSLAWDDKYPQLFWAGAELGIFRKGLSQVASQYPWGDVHLMHWNSPDAYRTISEHCYNKYLAHAEGVTYSSRLEYILSCRSVVVTHKLRYLQHFYHLFDSDLTSPNQNIVVVPGEDFKRLPETMEYLEANDERAEMIADNSYNFSRRWLNPAATNCYYRKLFHTWAEMQSFNVSVPDDTITWDSFSLIGRTNWRHFGHHVKHPTRS